MALAPWTIISLIGLALITGWLPFPVLTMLVGYDTRFDSLDARFAALEAQNKVMSKLLESQVMITRIICWNTGKSEDEKKAVGLYQRLDSSLAIAKLAAAPAVSEDESSQMSRP
jgi:hypothetical protein